MRRSNEKGEYELFYDQERVLAFDYEAICTNYDIDLRTMKELVNRTSKNNQTILFSQDESTE